MWKKAGVILVALTLVIGVLAGCGSNSSSKSSKSGSSSKKIVLKFAAQNDSTPATKAVIAAFNKQSKKYQVKWV
ncbi:MAG: ABC transporter substrate-binding protein, partial [Bacillus sp. (in: Bacteria)]|nr:ABC transporter substrate-binding protein [Bacillus sp. (in: firmicutes)]